MNEKHPIAPVLTELERRDAYGYGPYAEGGLLGVERAVLAKLAAQIAWEKREAERRAWEQGMYDALLIRGQGARPSIDRLYPSLPNPDAKPPEVPVWTRPSDGWQYRLTALKVWQWECSGEWNDLPTSLVLSPTCLTLADAESLAAYWRGREDGR